MRGLLVFGSDVTVAAPSSARVRDRLGSLDLLVVADSFPGATAELAHVVLPVAQWAEEDGTVTNLEGRVIRRRRAVEPPAGVLGDLEILGCLAARLRGGVAGFAFAGPEEVFEELRRASAGGRADYAGITYSRLDAGEELYWPCPDEGHPGTARPFAERFAHDDGRARLVAVDWRPAAEPPDGSYPLWFTTGRYREHYNSGNQTRRLPRLAGAGPQARLDIHDDLARRLEVDDGAEVIVESRRGSASFSARITADIRPDTVFAPIHWAGSAAANLLTVDALDPLSRMPELKACAVRVRAARS